jgi:uridine phosphorylase
MERLIALGAGYIISVGSCGSLQPDVPIGQILLPTGALVEEGTSAHYRGAGVKTAPNPALFGTIRDRLCAEGISPLEGRVWTTDAPFRETIDKVCAFQKAGILGVDMESSALMTVASFRGISFASVLVVSDELASLSWKRGFNDASYQERLMKAAETSVRVLAEKVTEEMQERRDGKA